MARLTIADLEIERNGDPFEIEMDDGAVFRLRDPRAIPAQQLLVIEKLPPNEQVKVMLGDDAEAFFARPDVDGYLLEMLLRRYAAHFGIGSLGEGSASPRSFNGTARPSKPTSNGKGRR